MEMRMMRPADIARRVRELANKRERQAVTATDPKVREQLILTARNYRALAAELDRKTPVFEDQPKTP
jgi:hypothetical protein